MSKFLTFEIKYSDPIPLILLNDDVALKQITEKEHFKNSFIYFICKAKKVRFDISSLEINYDTIFIDLISGRNRVHSEFSMIDGRKVSCYKDSSSKKLLIEVESISDPCPVILTPDLVLGRLGAHIGNRPEILYIGYSLSPIKRLRKHEKIIKALDELEDDEEIRVYINTFKYYLFEKNNGKVITCLEDIRIKRGAVSDKTLRDFMKMTERILINYFQPELNDNHINMSIAFDPLLGELLIKNGIKFFGGSFHMDGGEYFDFYSKEQKLEKKEFYFNFLRPEIGFCDLEAANVDFLK